MVELVQVFQGVTACINTTWGLLPVSVELMGLNPYESDPVLSLDVLFDVGVRVKCFFIEFSESNSSYVDSTIYVPSCLRIHPMQSGDVVF